MRRRFAGAALASVLMGGAAFAPTAGSQSESHHTADSIPATASVVGVVTKHPRRVLIVRSRFTPRAHPSPARVQQIILIEAARWGVSAAALLRRADCESSFRWWARNGPYVGVGQFHPSTFDRGVASIGTRIVRIVKVRWRHKRVVRIAHMSDGTTHRWRGWQVRQKVVHIHKGTIPRHPDVMHAWAQIRVMARALAGLGAVRSSEWECAA